MERYGPISRQIADRILELAGIARDERAALLEIWASLPRERRIEFLEFGRKLRDK